MASKQHALEAMEKSYSPYSRLKVGCSILCKDEEENSHRFQGTNIENASYGVTLCAEKAAIATMIASHPNWKTLKIKDIIILCDKEKKLYPCGSCLQFLSEFVTDETRITLFFGKKWKDCHKMYFFELFPYPFNKENVL